MSSVDSGNDLKSSSGDSVDDLKSTILSDEITTIEYDEETSLTLESIISTKEATVSKATKQETFAAFLKIGIVNVMKNLLFFVGIIYFMVNSTLMLSSH